MVDKPIEQEFSKISKKKQKFERLVVTKQEALDLFKGNPFKEAIISTKVPDDSRTTVYKCGDLIDLCRGPHLPHTGKVKAFSATRHSATNWLGDTKNDMLQRMYGISFPDKKMLKIWKENQEKVRTWFRKACIIKMSSGEDYSRISLSDEILKRNHNPKKSELCVRNLLIHTSFLFHLLTCCKFYSSYIRLKNVTIVVLLNSKSLSFSMTSLRVLPSGSHMELESTMRLSNSLGHITGTVGTKKLSLPISSTLTFGAFLVTHSIMLMACSDSKWKDSNGP